MNVASRAIWLLTAVWLLSASLAAAPEVEAEARKLFQEGVALHEANDFAAALEKFRTAYERWPNPAILPNVGTAAWESGRYVEAAEAYELYMEKTPPGASDRQDVEKALREALAKVGTLSIELRGGDAPVTIDGSAIAASRLHRVHVEPGSHRITATPAGAPPSSQMVDVAAGSTVRVVLQLGAAESDPVARGAEIRSAPTSTADSASSSEGSALPWVVGGIGVAGLATAGVLFVLRERERGELEDDCIGLVCPQSSQASIDRAERYGLFGMIALGVGVAGVGTSVVMLLTDDRERPTSRAAIDLGAVATPSGATVFASGRF